MLLNNNNKQQTSLKNNKFFKYQHLILFTKMNMLIWLIKEPDQLTH